MKKLIAVLALLCAQAHALTLVTEEVPSTLPFSESAANGGSSTEVMRELARRIGSSPVFRVLPWQSAYTMALDDPDTCVFAAARTPQRENLFKWVGPILPSYWSLYARADSKLGFNALTDARKYTVGVTSRQIREELRNAKFANIDEAPNEEENARKLKAGYNDLWAADNAMAPLIAKRLGFEVKLLHAAENAERYAACNLAMSDAEIGRMNAAMKAIQADGTFARLKKLPDVQ